MRCVLILAALDNVGRIWEADFERAIRIQTGVATGVIEMKVGVDDENDVRRSHSELSQTVLEHRQAISALILDPINILELLIFLVAGSCIDEDGPGRMLDQHTPHAELDAVALVG